MFTLAFIVQDALAEVVDAMHAYFLPGRFYSRNYPFMGFRSAMVHIALERARQLRRIASSMDSLDAAAVSLHEGPLSPALVAQASDEARRADCNSHISHVTTFEMQPSPWSSAVAPPESAAAAVHPADGKRQGVWDPAGWLRWSASGLSS
jgi:hypothetical protein